MAAALHICMRGYSDLIRTVTWEEALASAADPIERGKVAQAIIDHEFRTHGEDRWTPLHQAALRGELPYVPELTIREPEGFAFYAVYPELYAIAARRLPPSNKRLVIGVRTIGTTLGAVVASACNAAGFITLRPVGHPFHRQLAMDRAMRDYIRSFEDFAIVDEGPGLSGSTFGCIADFLEEHGVPLARIAFFPSHEGEPGNQCSERHRARWRIAKKYVTPFETILPSILREAESTIGNIDDVADIGGGAWREHVEHHERPPSSMSREPRKYLVRANGRRYLLKFSGLGRLATNKLEKARRIGVPILGNANGFLISEWIDGRIVDLDRDRDALTRAVRQHLEKLFETDNRMHRWEWIVTRSGEVIKCDALDHAHWHDAIGPQDESWDRAAAFIELGIRLGDDLPTQRYIETQLDRCEQTLSEPLPDDERALWERERERYSQCARNASTSASVAS